MIQYEIKISGRVQGVGFRHYVEQKAREFNLSGWAKNTVEGGVLVMVQGDREVLDTFCDYLQIGPTRARIDKISKQEMKILGKLHGFEVRF